MLGQEHSSGREFDVAESCAMANWVLCRHGNSQRMAHPVKCAIGFTARWPAFKSEAAHCPQARHHT